MIFYTSEIYLGDKNMMKRLCRPFHCVAEMNSRIIDNWNSKVLNTDEVYIVGNIGNPEYMRELNGTKYLIMSREDYDKYKEWVIINKYDDDLELNSELYNTYMSDVHKISRVNFFGRVYKMLNGNPIRIMTSKENMMPNIFSVIGSIGNLDKRVIQNDCFGINVSIDIHNYYPVSENEINNFMNNTFLPVQ